LLFFCFYNFFAKNPIFYNIIFMVKDKIICIQKYIYPFTILFFLADITLFTLFDTQILSFLLCFYTIVLLKQNQKLPIMFCLFTISLHSFLFYGQISPILYYIVPLSVLLRWVYAILNKSPIILYTALVAFVLTEQLFIGAYSMQKHYTFYGICGNILVIAIFLKYLPKGKLGNRL